MEKTITKTELEDFTKVVFKALDHCSITEISNAVVSVTNSNTEKRTVIERVIDSVSSVYSISREDLLGKKIRGMAQEARIVAYALLYFEFGQSYRIISKQIFGRKNHNGVVVSCTFFKELNPEKNSWDRKIFEKYNQALNLVKNQ